MAGEQPDLFHDCAWCGEPAIFEVEIEPEQFGMVARGDGSKIKTLTHAAITAWACDRHKHVAERADQAGNLNYRRIKDRHAEQLEMLPRAAKRPRSAIDEDAA